jgi:hypothetical protein
MADKSSAVHHVWLADEDLGIFDEQKFDLKDAFTIKGAVGLNVQPFFKGVNEQDPLCLQTLVWWLRFRVGNIQDRLGINFALSDLRIEDEPDPTQESSGTNAESISHDS